MSGDVVGLDQLIARLVLMATRSRRRHKPMRESGRHMVASIKHNFDVQGRPRWPGLKASTLRGRRHGGKIMQGPRRRFYRSIKHTVHDDRTVEAGTPDVIYAIFHHTGTRRGLVRRVAITLQDEDVPVIGGFFYRHITAR